MDHKTTGGLAVAADNLQVEYSQRTSGNDDRGQLPPVLPAELIFSR